MTTSNAATSTSHTSTNNINIYYRSTLTPAWKKDEKAIRDIITKNVTPVQPDHRIRLRIYYKTPRTSSLIMRNNQQTSTTLQQTNVVYRFKCSTWDCATRNVYYITGEHYGIGLSSIIYIDHAFYFTQTKLGMHVYCTVIS